MAATFDLVVFNAQTRAAMVSFPAANVPYGAFNSGDDFFLGNGRFKINQTGSQVLNGPLFRTMIAVTPSAPGMMDVALPEGALKDHPVPWPW